MLLAVNDYKCNMRAEFAAPLFAQPISYCDGMGVAKLLLHSKIKQSKFGEIIPSRY